MFKFRATEVQVKKNERKTEKLTEEIKILKVKLLTFAQTQCFSIRKFFFKKLKFTDIAIFGFENDDTFNQFIKSKVF